MCSVNFQHYLSLGVQPFIALKMPFRHRLHMDNDPKVKNKFQKWSHLLQKHKIEYF
jgi:hypothetical protein